MPNITGIIGSIPYRMAFAGGWIDQPFISQLNPTPPGSMGYSPYPRGIILPHRNGTPVCVDRLHRLLAIP